MKKIHSYKGLLTKWKAFISLVYLTRSLSSALPYGQSGEGACPSTALKPQFLGLLYSRGTYYSHLNAYTGFN